MKVVKCNMYESKVENSYVACFGNGSAGGILNFGISKVSSDGSDGVHFGDSLDDFFSYVLENCDFCIYEDEIEGNKCQFDVVTVYVHELKLASYWILSYLCGLGYIQNDDEWLSDGKYIKFIAAANGEFYMIGVHFGNKLVVFRNSRAILPLSVVEIRDSFCKKCSCLPLDSSIKDCICNTVRILSEAMHLAIGAGLNRLTLGSSAFNLLRKVYGFKFFKDDFPYLEDEYDKFIRRSYHGGFGYVNNAFVGEVVEGGCVVDINSLYPYIMMDEKFKLPYGLPLEDLSGDSLSGLTAEDFGEKFSGAGARYHFLEFSCTFKLKEGKIPFLRWDNMKDSEYFGDEVMEDTFVRDELVSIPLVLSQTDFLLMLQQYDIENFVPIRLVTFKARACMLSRFLYTYAQKKQKETGGERVVDKLIMNIISGKMATKRHRSSIQIDYSNGVLGFKFVENNTTSEGYIPYASALTSYGRWIIVNACQENYGNVLYSNVDCMALRCSESEAMGVRIHDSKIGWWKVEHKFDKAIFAKAQTYVLKCGDEYVIRASGMTDNCKRVLECYFKYCDLRDSGTCTPSNVMELFRKYRVNEEEVEWLRGMVKGRDFRGMEDFSVGLDVPFNKKIIRVNGCLKEECTHFSIV